MRVILDRFESDYAVCECEDKTMLNIEKWRLPENVKEGAALIVENGRITVDGESTESRRKMLEKLADDLFERT